LFKRIIAALAVGAALLVPTAASAAPKPAPTTGIDFDLVYFTQYGPAAFHVDDLRLAMVSADTACWYLTLSGDPIWKDIDGDGVGEWLVQSQDPSVYPFSVQGACWAVSQTFGSSLRSGSYLGPIANCETGTIDLTQFGVGGHSLPYVGQTSGELEWIHAQVDVPILTADTPEERRAVCSLARAAASGISNARYVQLLNETLARLATS
jgi:hypothetical protein